MLIYKTNSESKYYIFIHIPKNSGCFIRQQIKGNPDNILIKNYWDIDSIDLAHIPYILKNKYIDTNIDYNYFAHSRNPYDRIISGFFYRTINGDIEKLKNFIKNELTLMKFILNYDPNIIHYYPQYLFVCDINLDIPSNIKITKIETFEGAKKYDLTKYLDNECIKIINKIYKKDFLFFGYEMIDNI